MPTYIVLPTAMKTRENELKALKAKTGISLYIKGMKQGKHGNKGNKDKKPSLKENLKGGLRIGNVHIVRK